MHERAISDVASLSVLDVLDSCSLSRNTSSGPNITIPEIYVAPSGGARLSERQAACDIHGMGYLIVAIVSLTTIFSSFPSFSRVIQASRGHSGRARRPV